VSRTYRSFETPFSVIPPKTATFVSTAEAAAPYLPKGVTPGGFGLDHDFKAEN
jgi:hypothetical protein